MTGTICTRTDAHREHTVHADGGEYLGHCRGRLPEPFVGMPATINLYTDTRPAVVVKVNAKSIVLAAVAVDAATTRWINNEGEPYPCLAADGILTEVIGSPERYTRVDTPQGPRFRNGTVGVTLGRAVQITDYRY
jgi:hypothetical protein